MLITRRHGPLLELALDRPDKHNALSNGLALELSAALAAARDDPAVSAVLLRGEGRSFCSGGDIEQFAQMDELGLPELHAEGRASVELFSWGRRLGKPLIGAVHGACMGGGLGLAAMCDVLIAARSAKFAASEIRIGLFPFVIVPALIDALGYRRALELALSGRNFGAEQAQAWGLAQHVVEDAELPERALALAGEIAARSPVALRLGLEAFRAARGTSGVEAFEAMNAYRHVVLKSADLKEGAMAFFEKRAPQWTGH
jgi:methylglutaconyl-CoA hydratase